MFYLQPLLQKIFTRSSSSDLFYSVLSSSSCLLPNHKSLQPRPKERDLNNESAFKNYDISRSRGCLRHNNEKVQRKRNHIDISDYLFKMRFPL